MAIERMGAPIRTEFVDNGPQALERLISDTEFHPDFIFIDFNMPCMNGLECLSEIKKIHRLNQVHIYMWSTSIDSSLSQNCISMGAADFIKKVSTIPSLKEILWNIFYERKITCI
jgi:CheY-like chemotaxis protein